MNCPLPEIFNPSPVTLYLFLQLPQLIFVSLQTNPIFPVILLWILYNIMFLFQEKSTRRDYLMLLKVFKYVWVFFKGLHNSITDKKKRNEVFRLYSNKLVLHVKT